MLARYNIGSRAIVSSCNGVNIIIFIIIINVMLIITISVIYIFSHEGKISKCFPSNIEHLSCVCV